MTVAVKPPAVAEARSEGGLGRRVADGVAERLALAGVRHAFGMPGGEVVTMLDALEGAGIRFVLTRAETAGAIAAAGTSLFSGAPGLLLTTLGPGLASAVNGIADAWQERMPLIVLSGVVDRPLQGRYTHQIVDHAALLGPLVKASVEVPAEGAAAVVDRAIRLALAEPMGPVHLDLAPEVAASPAPARAPLAPSAWRIAAPAPDRDDPLLAKLRVALAGADRPVIVAGFDAARGGAGPALRRLSERHGIPVVTTYKGKGVVDERGPLSLGAAGLSPKADSLLLPLLREADLVLLAGYDPIEMRPGWLDPFSPGATVIGLASLGDHGMHRADLAVDGPLASLLDALAPAEVRPRWRGGEVEAARRALAAAFAVPRTPAGETWGPHAVVAALARALPEEAVVTIDSGAHRILLSQMWQARRPLRLLQSAGWCTMGSALPLALGAGLAGEGEPVVAVLGDGGLEMTLGELATLRDQGIPAIVLVLQDESLALIELKQRQAGLARAGVALGATDYAAVARGFGIEGLTARGLDELEAALASALERSRTRRGPTLIACPIEASQYADAL